MSARSEAEEITPTGVRFQDEYSFLLRNTPQLSCGRRLLFSLLHPLHVFAGLGVYTNGIAFFDEKGGLHGNASFQFYRFRSALCGIASDGRWRFHHLQVRFYREFYGKNFFAETDGDYLGVGL